MTIANLVCTTLARSRNKADPERAKQSMKYRRGGCLSSPPQLALTINAHVLGSSHRLVMFKKLLGDSSSLKIRVYYDFANAPNEKLIADCKSDVR